MEGIVSWGTTAWSSLVSHVVAYESTIHSRALFIHKGRICSASLHPFAGQASEESRNPMWELICGATLWVIWKCRCTRVFTGKSTPPAEGIKEIWSESVHSLKGQYDDIQGDSEAAIKMRHEFLLIWTKTPFCALVGSTLKWNYCAPVWLYPPPA